MRTAGVHSDQPPYLGPQGMPAQTRRAPAGGPLARVAFWRVTRLVAWYWGQEGRNGGRSISRALARTCWQGHRLHTNWVPGGVGCN